MMADDPLAALGGLDPTGVPVPGGNDPGAADPGAVDPGAAPADGGAGQKSPLDVLEELLKESQAKAGAAGQGPGAPGGMGAMEPAPDPNQPTPEQLQLQAEMEEKLRQQAIIDQQHLEEQRVALGQIKDTPQYKARVQQDQDKVDEQQSKQSAGQGFDIKQLEHTKI